MGDTTVLDDYLHVPRKNVELVGGPHDGATIEIIACVTILCFATDGVTQLNDVSTFACFVSSRSHYHWDGSFIDDAVSGERREKFVYRA
jgi:hypothetical protein